MVIKTGKKISKKAAPMCWIAAVDSDSFNYSPAKVIKKEAEKEEFTCHKTKQGAQKECDKKNSQ